jgi:hypothetical protein
MMKSVMLTWLRYRYQLSQLQLRRRFARKNEDWKTINSLTEAIYISMTDYLTDTAEKLMIEVPHPTPPIGERRSSTSLVFT